jgi:TonB family protein
MQILERLADVSVRALLLAAIAWPATKLIRTAAARHGIWCALLAGMLAMPILAPLLPPIHSAVVTRYAPPFAGFDVSVPKVSTAHSASRTAPITLPPQPQQPRWATLLACFYLAAVLSLLTRFAHAYWLSRSLVRKSSPIRDEHPLNLMEDLAGAQSLPWPLPQLRASHDVVVPVTVGWRDPVILLPDGWQDWDAWKLYAVLAHELAHIRRGDWLVTVAASLNRCLFWFHPLAWWLERQLSALSEQACDEAALHTVSDAPRYARAVLEFATALQNGRRVAYGVAMARTAKVSRRIDRILELRTPGPGIMRKSAWIAVLACALPLVYSAAALQVAQPGIMPQKRGGWADMLTEGSKLSPAEVQDLEAQLAAGADELTTRGKLISYYYSHNMAVPFRDHVYWLVEHHPEIEFAVYASNLQLGSAIDTAHIKTLWLDAVAAHPQNAQILANAARYIGALDDQFTEEDLLKRARELEPAYPEWLKLQADLLARAIYHSFLEQVPVIPHVQPGFVEAAKTELETSTDAILVGTVGEFLAGGPPGGHPVEPSREFAEHLLNRAQNLSPDNPEWSAALQRLHAAPENTPPQPAVDSSQRVQRIRVGAEVQQSNLIQQTTPAYPPLAKQARIQGVVRFSVIIGKDGHISNMTLISGHPLLVPAAQEAVKQWLYRPTLLNGDPVEVATLVDVQFTLAN